MGPFERIQGFAGICTSRYGHVGLTVQVGPLGIRAEKLRASKDSPFFGPNVGSTVGPSVGTGFRY